MRLIGTFTGQACNIAGARLKEALVKKMASLFTAILCLTTLVACGGEVDEKPATEATEESPAISPTLEVPTKELPILQSTSYPPPPTAAPPGVNVGYPAYTPLPTRDPYPGGLATIVHPMGLQCEEVIFPDLSAAISSLEEAGIKVMAAEEIALNVCDACGCATSEHFRIQINAEDLASSLEMGWQR